MITNFKDPNYLLTGNWQQQRAFHVLQDLRVFEVLAGYDPVLAGTVPIELDLPDSDLDIICSFEDERAFTSTIETHYGEAFGFTIRKTSKQSLSTVIANFQHQTIAIEFFGQPLPVHKQMAFLHLVKEYEILQEKDDSFRQAIIQLKKQGMSTEAAFGKLLGIEGDPYLGLLTYQNEVT